MALGDGLHLPGAPSIVAERPAAASTTGGVAAGHSMSWPTWAGEDLDAAVRTAATLAPGASVAAGLYREWFSPVVERARPYRRPLAGLYRASHAATGIHREGSFDVADRHDVIGSDGWWRTWGRRWTPPRHRPGSVRLFLTPRGARLGEFVHTVTAALATSEAAWSLACATDERRMRRVAGATLDLPDLEVLPDGALERLAPLLHPVRPPLTLPIAPGVGLAAHPGNGMSFGEHRCHLVALALRHPSGTNDPLRAIAAVFAAHGVVAAHPYR